MLSLALWFLGLPDSSLGLLYLPVYLSTVGFLSCFCFWFLFVCFAFPPLLPRLLLLSLSLFGSTSLVQCSLPVFPIARLIHWTILSGLPFPSAAQAWLVLSPTVDSVSQALNAQDKGETQCEATVSLPLSKHPSEAGTIFLLNLTVSKSSKCTAFFFLGPDHSLLMMPSLLQLFLFERNSDSLFMI